MFEQEIAHIYGIGSLICYEKTRLNLYYLQSMYVPKWKYLAI